MDNIEPEVFGLNGFIVLQHDRYQEDLADSGVAVGVAISPVPSKKITPGDRVLFPWGAERYVITVGEDQDYVAVPEDALVMVVKAEAPADGS